MSNEVRLNGIVYSDVSHFRYRFEEDYSVYLPEFDVALFDVLLAQDDPYLFNHIEVPNYLSLTNDGWLKIYRGYSWDGASGPFTINNKTIRRGSSVHDPLFQFMRLGLLPRNLFFHPANRAFRRICLEDGMTRFRAYYVFRAVERFGWKYAGGS